MVFFIKLRRFCLQNACLIFCTASNSVSLHTMNKREFVVIDEAAQLKECESLIPLQLSGLRHAILVGDERQLPAMVQSKINEEAEFGRSLFERLASLGHKKHLLNVQYRMHPSISQFPNREFYDKQILDGENVKSSAYEKCFLPVLKESTYRFPDPSKALQDAIEAAGPLLLSMSEYMMSSFNESRKIWSKVDGYTRGYWAFSSH